jgi:hypothetical protein
MGRASKGREQHTGRVNARDAGHTRRTFENVLEGTCVQSIAHTHSIVTCAHMGGTNTGHSVIDDVGVASQQAVLTPRVGVDVAAGAKIEKTAGVRRGVSAAPLPTVCE